MEWYVFYYNINRNKIEKFNIFDHAAFADDCAHTLERYSGNRDGFTKEVKRNLMYYFWSKCEWEIEITGFPPSDNGKPLKTDVYTQVMLNFDKFIDYLWNHQTELRQYKRKVRNYYDTIS